jgi:hypothetical protein
MAASVVLGFAAIRRRDVDGHRAWMIRAYALAVGAGTQVVTQGIGEAAFGTSDLSTGLSVSAGWVVNAAVAEWVIRRPARTGRATGRTATTRAATTRPATAHAATPPASPAPEATAPAATTPAATSPAATVPGGAR